MRTSLRIPVSAAALACLAPLLSACATSPEERAARMQADMAQMITVYGPACVRLGYTAESDAWRNCVLQLSTKDELRRLGNTPSYYGGWGPRWRGAGYWGPYW
jgi:hypothetical protein